MIENPLTAERIERDGDDITLQFSKVFLVQEMEGAFEDSLWTQAVSITISDCEIDGDLPACPCELRGGDFIDNIYTYRNHVTLPISWRGDVGCRLDAGDGAQRCSISGTAMAAFFCSSVTFSFLMKRSMLLPIATTAQRKRRPR